MSNGGCSVDDISERPVRMPAHDARPECEHLPPAVRITLDRARCRPAGFVESHLRTRTRRYRLRRARPGCEMRGRARPHAPTRVRLSAAKPACAASGALGRLAAQAARLAGLRSKRHAWPDCTASGTLAVSAPSLHNPGDTDNGSDGTDLVALIVFRRRVDAERRECETTP